MSLRRRLLLVAFVVIVAVIACVQIAWHLAQSDWLRRVPQYHNDFFRQVLSFAYDPKESGEFGAVEEIARRGPNAFRSFFRDVLITNTPSGAPGSVDVNPIGARHRDPVTFPLGDVRAGIRAAMESRSAVLAGSGYCLPIELDGDVVGGAWFEPIVPAPPRLPLSAYMIPMLIGGLLFGGIAYVLIERGVVKPLHDLGAAAASVGAQRPGVQMPAIAGAQELARFIDAFNEMAARVDGHRDELEREVKRATEIAERRQHALLRSARLASMGTLAAGIAHEINNPIGGMLNAVRRIAESEGLSDRDRRYVDLIREGLERVGGIARRVLDFTPRQIEPVPFTIRSALDGAHGLAAHRFSQENVELRIELPDDLPELHGDAHEFQQVLLNVFINSLDVLQGRPEPRYVAVTAVEEGEQVVIRIADNGPGMAPDDLAFVMDPFYSGKGRPDASGLGMFISHQIIDNHGGRLEVESEPGAGFTVTIRMPIEPAG